MLILDAVLIMALMIALEKARKYRGKNVEVCGNGFWCRNACFLFRSGEKSGQDHVYALTVSQVVLPFSERIDYTLQLSKCICFIVIAECGYQINSGLIQNVQYNEFLYISKKNGHCIAFKWIHESSKRSRKWTVQSI